MVECFFFLFFLHVLRKYIYDLLNVFRGKWLNLLYMDFKGCAANMLVPDTTAHLQGVHASGLFWQQKGDQHSIRQVVIMLCLIGVFYYYL